MSDKKEMCAIKKYVLVAPEGGWGCMICLAVITNLVTTTAFLGCFGIIFNDFLIEIDMKSTGVTILTGISAMCVAIGGFLANSLLKIISLRKLSFLSAIIFDLGMFGCVFVNSKFPFYICQGVMQGVGLGLSFNVSYSILNQYFVKKRLLANSLAQAIIGLCTMFAPTLCNWSLNKYGFRGTLLILTGISMQNIVAACMLQPVKWHMKRIEINEDQEKQSMLVEVHNNADIETPTVKLTDEKGNLKGSVEKVYEFPSDAEKVKGWRRFVGMFVDISLCETYILSCPCIGIGLLYFADGVYSMILPQALYAANWDQDSVAWALSSLLFGDLAMRIIMIFTSKWLLKLGNQEIFIFAIFIGIVSRLGMLWSVNRIPVIIYIGLIGVSHSIFAVLIAVVVADVVAPSQFTSALGITLMMAGILNLTLAPAVGAIRDLTNSYPTAFYVLTCVYGIVFLFWSIELLYKRNEHKRIAREESLKQRKKCNTSK